MYKTIYDHSAEITQAVTNLYKKTFRVLSDQLIFYEVVVGKNYFFQPSNYCQPRGVYRNSLNAF
ncbi:hypothetical protein VK90_19640 [Bacillus sp. LK2]|nr:hypothetical protein VK90_19640 [Bacillus sp. LK2]